MATLTKADMARALIILLDLEDEDQKELEKVKVAVLQRMFEGQKKNALAYGNMYELYKKYKL